MRFSRSPAWIIPGKYQTCDNFNTPAPNAYSSIKNRPSSPSWKIGNSSKCSYFDKSDTPGPGAYNTMSMTNTSFGKINKPSTKQIKKVWKQKVGPGAYNPNYLALKQSGNSFSMRQKLTPKYQNDVPGPGQYEHQSTLSTNKTNIGKAPRQWIQFDKQVPGPGLYNPNQIETKSKGYSIGKQPRCQSAVPSTKLGPGQYQNTSLFDDQIKFKKGYSISSKPPPESVSCVPGPNAYFKTDNTKKIRPSSAMQNRQKRFDTKQNQNPGPGAYDQRDSNLKDNKKSPGWTYGKQVKLKTTISQVPAPNFYNIPSYLSICQKK